MRYLLLICVAFIGCTSQSKNKDLSGTKWFLTSIERDTVNRSHNVDFLMMGNTDSVSVTFNKDSISIQLSAKGEPVIAAYSINKDTIFFNTKSGEKDTLLILSHTDDSLVVHGIKGMNYRLRRQ